MEGICLGELFWIFGLFSLYEVFGDYLHLNEREELQVFEYRILKQIQFFQCHLSLHVILSVSVNISKTKTLKPCFQETLLTPVLTDTGATTIAEV